MTAAHSDPHIGLVVEGRGETNAVPLLLRRWLQEQGNYEDILGKPIVCNGRGNATRAGGIEGMVVTAVARPGCRGVLIVLDADRDPVCMLGPSLRKRAQCETGLPIAVCLAEPKFEAWIMASAESMELPLSYPFTSDPCFLIEQALGENKYAKPTWQPRLTSRIELGRAAARDRSLRRTLACLNELVARVS
jgi:hypothetical protein